MYLDVGYVFLGYINNVILHGRIIGKCIEIFGDMIPMCLWRLCNLCSFCKRRFSHSSEILKSDVTSLLRPKCLCRSCEEGICTCSIILKTNKTSPHWSWTRRHSSLRTNSVIIYCLQISWFASLSCVYVLQIWTLIFPCKAF